MKLFYMFFISVLLMVNVACASPSINIKLHVVDDEGQPVEKAKVDMGFLLGQGGNAVDGLTDSKGYFEATENGIFGVKIFVEKVGYYESKYRTGYGDQELTLLFREKKNPIAMYAKKIKILAPIYDKEFGYDLVKGDYVKPYGKGEVSDFIFRVQYDEKDFWHSDYHLSVKFSNPNDGLVPFFIEHSESEYKSDYFTPETGYKNEWEFKRISRKGKADDTNLNKKRNYYLRVRTEVNEDGAVESAYYGKIYGEFPGIMHYLNPEPNDRNIEFGRNLLSDLANNEKVREP